MLKVTIYKNLLKEINRSLLIKDEEKSYWLNNYRILPVASVKYFLQILKRSNKQMDEFLKAGLDADPKLTESIIIKSNLARKKYFHVKEEEEHSEDNPEQLLEQKLKNI